MSNLITFPLTCQPTPATLKKPSKSKRCFKGLSDSTYLRKNVPELTAGQTQNRISKRRFDGDLSKVIGAVRGVEVYESTVVVKRFGNRQTGGGQRGQIMNLSSGSLARLAFTAFNTPAHFPSMMTLTEPAKYSTDGRKVKQRFKNFVDWYRFNFPGQLFLWWLEFQKRGAPHFHVLTTVDLVSLGKLATIRRKSKLTGRKTWRTHWDTWQKLEAYWRKSGGGFTAWEVINNQDGGKKYAAKYATKAYQKAVPEAYRDVGRFWGHSSKGVKPEPNALYECNEEQLRAALQRGGWEFLPDDGELIYRELYQAAASLDESQLKPVSDFVDLTIEQEISRATGQLPGAWSGLVLANDEKDLGPPPERDYTCTVCGNVTRRWSGQCESCGEWNSLTGV